MAKVYFDADPEKTNTANHVLKEEITAPAVRVLTPLVHDLFYLDDLVLYTNPANKNETLLTRENDYDVEVQDSIATEQSGRAVYRYVILLKPFAQVYADYWAYGDIISGNQMTQTAGDAEEGLYKANQALSQIVSHKEDGGAHGATAENAPGAIARRNSGGTFKVSLPTDPLHPVRKQEMDAEVEARSLADATEASARAQADAALAGAVAAEADARSAADEAQVLKIAALEGLGGYLDPNNFGTSTPSQNTLDTYAIADIGTITNASEIFNGTRVRNTFDQHLWILANTPDSDPPVHVWSDQGVDVVGIANTTTAGIVKGAGEVEIDPFGNMAVPVTITDVAASTTQATAGKWKISELLQIVLNNIASLFSAKANLISPALGGTPSAPTAAAKTNTTQLATTEFVQRELNNVIIEQVPIATADEAGIVRPGSGIDVDPLTGEMTLAASPALTGTPTAPTATAKTNSTQIATTAYADRAALPPVGSYYTQYMDESGNFDIVSSPATLYPGTTWTLRHNTMGLFWRTEGGQSANVGRTNGVQEDAIRNICGRSLNNSIGDYVTIYSDGAISRASVTCKLSASQPFYYEYGPYFIFDANLNNINGTNPMAGHANGSEIRPRNGLIRIYERTA